MPSPNQQQDHCFRGRQLVSGPQRLGSIERVEADSLTHQSNAGLCPPPLSPRARLAGGLPRVDPPAHPLNQARRPGAAQRRTRSAQARVLSRCGCIRGSQSGPRSGADARPQSSAGCHSARQIPVLVLEQTGAANWLLRGDAPSSRRTIRRGCLQPVSLWYASRQQILLITPEEQKGASGYAY